MPVKHDSRIYRNLDLAIAPSITNTEENNYVVEGYATTFNDPYELYAGISEVIDIGALDSADMSDVIFQYDHEGKVLARTSNNTLQIYPDDHGLKVVVDLSTSRASREMYEEIKSGLITKMSWAFSVEHETFDNKSNTRHIASIKKVYDVSAVSIPANDATEISARRFCDGVIEKRAEECRRREALQLVLDLKLKGLTL